MKGEVEVENFPEERTVRIRMSGELTVACMREMADRYRAIADYYHGRAHLILADLRGSEPLGAEAATVLGEAIEHSRRSGVVCCAHISDETVQRLQAARLARQSSPTGDVTVDVVSLEEAERVLEEAREPLGPLEPSGGEP